MVTAYWKGICLGCGRVVRVDDEGQTFDKPPHRPVRPHECDPAEAVWWQRMLWHDVVHDVVDAVVRIPGDTAPALDPAREMR